MQRRSFLRSALSVVALAVGWLKPRHAHAAEWSKDAFSARTVDEALKHLYGSATPTPSANVQLQAPFQASDGARVAITVSTKLTDVQSISILVDKNPRPLAAHVTPRGDTAAYFSTTIKMAATSDVRCIIKTGDRLYSAKQTIKVTVGGCG